MSNWIWYMGGGGGVLESFVWLSMDHSRDNFWNNYLIFMPNYFILKKDCFLFLLTFKIIISHLSYKDLHFIAT
jgi:hypothetical protein